MRHCLRFIEISVLIINFDKIVTTFALRAILGTNAGNPSEEKGNLVINCFAADYSFDSTLSIRLLKEDVAPPIISLNLGRISAGNDKRQIDHNDCDIVQTLCYDFTCSANYSA